MQTGNEVVLSLMLSEGKSSMDQIKVHLHTDIGGDTDDLCALAMVLNWPDADLVGVTTAHEDGGRRAGYPRLNSRSAAG